MRGAYVDKPSAYCIDFGHSKALEMFLYIWGNETEWLEYINQERVEDPTEVANEAP